VELEAFADWGVGALVTTRAAGSFGTASDEPARAVLGRWDALLGHLAAAGVARLATARQVHGAELISHVPAGPGGCAAEMPTGISPTTAGRGWP
jgi:hypothetical protein